jgi:hypothetical protein
MEFYIQWFWKTGHLTMQSAFVRSGVLWSPFPFLTTLIVLVFILVFLVMFVRSVAQITNIQSTVIRLLKATGWALLTSILCLAIALFSDFVFEGIIYAPQAVVKDAATAATDSQRDADYKQCQESMKQLRASLAPPPVDPRYMAPAREFEFSDYLQAFRDPRSHVHLECINEDQKSCDIAALYRDRFAAAQWAIADPIRRIPAAEDVDTDPKLVTVFIRSEKLRPAEATALYRELPHVGVESGMKRELTLNPYDFSLRIRRKRP